jgi:hypothetical protein
MTDTTYTPGERLNDLCTEVLVAAHLARDRRLVPDYADALAMRVRSPSADMIEDSDAALLRSAANALSQMSTRIKSADVRPRAKTGPSPGPSIAEMIRQLDAEQIASGGPFNRNEFEATERARVEEANRQLAKLNRSIEESRRR